MKQRVGSEYRACWQITGISCPRNRLVYTICYMLVSIVSYAYYRFTVKSRCKTREAFLAEKALRSTYKLHIKFHTQPIISHFRFYSYTNRHNHCKDIKIWYQQCIFWLKNNKTDAIKVYLCNIGRMILEN